MTEKNDGLISAVNNTSSETVNELVFRERQFDCVAVPESTRPLIIDSAGMVTVFLATHNGERFLATQLESIIQQTYQSWQIIVSDDGSTDRTQDILRGYQERLGVSRLIIKNGPCSGFCANFMALAGNAAIDGDFFAFCDQDDYWHPDHLQRALNWLTENQSSTPSLHCGRTHLINERGDSEGKSAPRPRMPSFSNALIQSLAGGNTMVFNAAARNLLVETAHLNIISHDWWLYILVSGANGRIKYDNSPSVDYRQHGKNIIGGSSTLRKQLAVLRRINQGQLKGWNSTNLDSLSQCLHLLEGKQKIIFEQFVAARRKYFLARCQGIRKSGVSRQTTIGNFGFFVAALLNKV